VAYASLLVATEPESEPITFESEAEKPTRAPSRAKKAVEAETDEVAEVEEIAEAEDVEEPETGEAELEDAPDDEPEDEPAESIDAEADGAPVKKKTRRGSRGGRNRKKKPATAATPDGESESAEPDDTAEPASPASPRIHVPDFELGETEKKPARKRTPAKPKPTAETVDDEADEQVADAVAEETDGAEPVPAKKKTRRGSRGGRNRKKPAVAVAAGGENGAEPAAPEASGEPSGNGAEPKPDEYVPMSEWLDDLDA
jgi:ribonuclease E